MKIKTNCDNKNKVVIVSDKNNLSNLFENNCDHIVMMSTIANTKMRTYEKEQAQILASHCVAIYLAQFCIG